MKVTKISGFTVYLNYAGRVHMAYLGGVLFYPWRYNRRLGVWQNCVSEVTPVAFRSGLRRGIYKFA